ncbi:MAG: GntR family transcriptional regulator [Planctomycetota bacterium]
MFTIQFNSGVPIYRQVFDQVVREIDRGRFETGELLPSVRQLASDLGVNPMTVSKAYSLLETESVVERKRGVGMVVTRKAEKPEDYLKPAIERLVADAQHVGVSKTRLNELIRKYWNKPVKPKK